MTLRVRAPAGMSFAWAALLGLGCAGDPGPASKPARDEPWLTLPPDFPPIPTPEDNELTRDRAELGKQLFFDTRLSRTYEIACGTCHLQAAAFADPKRVSTGVEGRTGTRNAPALVNAAWSKSFFWDGGVPSLELQAVGPIQNPLEMDMTLEEVAERLALDAPLTERFESAYGEGPSEFTISRAVASFVRTLVSGNSPYDRFRRGDGSALGAGAQRGQTIFMGERGECFHCHTGMNLAIDEFRNNGGTPDDPDLGRATISHSPLDEGRFKVPTLRNVAVSAPYMHDGSLATLADVIEQYDAGGRGHPDTDPVIQPLGLSDEEKADLLEFLESLTDQEFLENPRFRPD